MSSSEREQQGTAPQPPAVLERILGSRAGWVAGSDGAGGLLVDFEDNAGGPVAAQLALALDAKSIQEAISARRKVVLLFEEGDPRRPFLMAFLHEPSPTPLLDSLLEKQAAPRVPVEARVDGKRVMIEGKDEVVLQCGEASITLRRNGKVVIRGTQVESHAKGCNRIKGNSVEVN